MAYACLVLWQWLGWRQLSKHKISILKSSPHLTIVVAARNEEANILSLLASLQAQVGVGLSIVVVDDHSTDRTAALVAEAAIMDPRIKLLTLTDGFGKKAAIELAVSASATEFVLCTDADCHAGPNWAAKMLGQALASKSDMILGPVVLAPAINALGHFQSIEMNAIMGVTGGMVAHGHPIMANGANILFNRKAFLDLGGYGSNVQNPSGDDVFLMLAMQAKRPGSVGFCKDTDALVCTAPIHDLPSFIEQRKRWLSKRSGYTDGWVKGTAIITYLGNVAALSAIVLLPFNPEMSLLALLIKSVPDLMLIRAEQRNLWPECGWGRLILAEFFVIVYVSLIGLMPTGNYVWKDRHIEVKNG